MLRPTSTSIWWITLSQKAGNLFLGNRDYVGGQIYDLGFCFSCWIIFLLINQKGVGCCSKNALRPLDERINCSSWIREYCGTSLRLREYELQKVFKILKKICDHPLLLTKRAAEGVLEGMDTMLNREELGMVEETALNLANMSNHDDILKNGDNENLIKERHHVLIFSQTRKMLNLVQVCSNPCAGFEVFN
ncbi:hypothetical protein HPP92_000094 [Vanilla planifolia]|uniref:Uncharacterized protein n=1 Tax=Vanilla planifolia TaxID=51239 RepID=A0A835S9J0_VANPL|nr:hypothetical protein HPP92_000094 [Vanilla planifolia]